MKKFIFLAAIAATVVASCSKEPISQETKVKEGMIPYTATVKFDATKSTIDDREIVWEVGEKVAIFDGVNTEPNKFTVTEVTSAGASIEGMISEVAEKIYGVYPYSAAVGLTISGSSTIGDSLTVKLPSTQIIEAGKVIASDALVTVSEEADPYGGYLSFYNPFSVLKFTVPVDGVKKVVFSGLDGKGVTGNQTVRVDDHGNKEIVVKGKSSLTVSKADGFAKNTAYYATVFSRDVAGLRFVLTADDYISTIESSKTVAFVRNSGLTFNFTEEQINNGKTKVLLPGEFSVSATKKVKFTKGNLWCDTTATPVEWHLESSQTAYPTAWSTDHVGHLFWTKTAAASYAETYDDGELTKEDVPFFAESKGGLTVDGQSGLYALSKGEWNYLINSRTSGLYKYGVTVTDGSTNYTNCLILAPDDYTGTALSEITDWSLSNINTLGLVCLPAVGDRDGKTLNAGKSCNYWSATPSEIKMFNSTDYNFAYYFYNFDNPSSAYRPRGIGRSVRLVSTVSK